MSHTEELIHKAQSGDRNASEALVTENSGLIWSVARRFLGRGAEADDLYQLGCLGFLKAVEGFELEYGTQFSTYAVPKIAGEIRPLKIRHGPCPLFLWPFRFRQTELLLWLHRFRTIPSMVCQLLHHVCD